MGKDLGVKTRCGKNRVGKDQEGKNCEGKDRWKKFGEGEVPVTAQKPNCEETLAKFCISLDFFFVFS